MCAQQPRQSHGPSTAPPPSCYNQPAAGKCGTQPVLKAPLAYLPGRSRLLAQRLQAAADFDHSTLREGLLRKHLPPLQNEHGIRHFSVDHQRTVNVVTEIVHVADLQAGNLAQQCAELGSGVQAKPILVTQTHFLRSPRTSRLTRNVSTRRRRSVSRTRMVALSRVRPCRSTQRSAAPLPAPRGKRCSPRT